MNSEVTANVHGGRYRFGNWLLVRFRSTFEYDTPFWLKSAIGLWMVYAASLVVTALGMPTGLGVMFDTLTLTFLGTLAMILAGSIVAFLFTLMYIPLPRFFIGSLLYTGFVFYYILYYAEMGILVSAAIAGVLTGAGAAIGFVLAVLLTPRWSVMAKVSTVIAVSMLFTVLYMQADNSRADNSYADQPAIAASAALHSQVMSLQELGNPAIEGNYKFDQLSYGSGNDQHRSEFGAGVSLTTPSVDASDYITRWPWLRELFWGFDETALPINGRVWKPEGEGPFPLVLMVHGNHLMEQFSDDGYGYLGELLASRGAIAVSVDENFLNYSVWSGIPNQDMKMRAWVLLKHLQQLETFNELPGNPLYKKVDLSRVVLLGHSRGGQAAAMAADSNRWFAEDESLTGLEQLNIRGVIAIAPTDKQVDKTSAVLKNTSYLTIQGAMDGDVNNFYGDRQYMRTSFSAQSEGFKASLYIGKANHSRFNTSWGSMDDSLPGGLLLNRDMLDPDHQREMAKVYVSAFIDTVLKEQSGYAALFRDYRAGRKWLPSASYVSRYEDESFVPLARFDEDQNKTMGASNSEITAEGVQWSEVNALDRERNSKGTRGAVLEWPEGKGGFYSITLSDRYRSQLANSNHPTILTFSLANLERDLREEGGVTKVPKIQIEFETIAGSRIMLPLSDFMPVVAPPHSQFTIAPWMEARIKGGKYKESAEPVFQTYRLPLEQFEQAGFPIEASNLASITFHLQRGPGKVMLDDIGFSH